VRQQVISLIEQNKGRLLNPTIDVVVPRSLLSEDP
jgi:hypothetical protein